MITRINRMDSNTSMISKPVSETPQQILFHNSLTSYFSFPRSLSAADLALTTRHSLSEGIKSAETTVSKKAAMAILTTNILFQWWSGWYWSLIWKKKKHSVRKFLIGFHHYLFMVCFAFVVLYSFLLLFILEKIMCLEGFFYSDFVEFLNEVKFRASN